MTFNSHKRPDTQPNMIQHGTQSAALGAFNQTLLLQSAMIHFNAPRGFGKLFALRLAHPVKTRRPVLRRAVCRKDTKYFDFAESFKPDECAIAAAQSGFRNGLQFARACADLPVRFEPRQKMPTQRAHQFQVFNRSIPAIETNQLRTKTALGSRQQHLGKVVVLSFAVTVFIKHAIINWDAPFAVRPEQSNQVDAGNDRLLLARPMAIDKSVKLRIRFLKGRARREPEYRFANQSVFAPPSRVFRHPVRAFAKVE